MMPMGGMKGPGQMAPMGKPVGGQNPQAAAMFNQMNQAPPPAVPQGLGRDMPMRGPMQMGRPFQQGMQRNQPRPPMNMLAAFRNR